MKGFYNSKWQGEIFRPTRNPFDNSVNDEVPVFGPEVLDDTFAGLEKGRLEMSTLSREAHQEIFIKLLEIVTRSKNDLVHLIQVEQGKPLREAVMEYESGRHSIEILAENGSLMGSEFKPLAREPASRGHIGFTLRQPHGVVAVLTPMVYPFLFPVIQVCYALAVGNSVLLKPATTTPLTALRLVEMLLEAGLPTSAIACLPGTGSSLGSAICADGRVNYLSCMGRLATIRKVRSNCGFFPTQLQWGCVSSVIVDENTDLDRFVPILMSAAFDNAGQSAFTTSWIAAVDSVHDELVDRLAALIGRIKLGNPVDEKTEVGPVGSRISQSRFDRIMETERAAGAEVVCGGTRKRRLIQPTLLRNCEPGASILTKRESSAPVVGVSRVKNPQDVIKVLSHQRYHILSIFTEHEGEAVKSAMDLPFENIYVNLIPNWRDGLICVPGHPPRCGLRSSYDRVADLSRIRDVVCRDVTGGK
ncbi:MAG: aldehyde dehydrogenase family protein [Verrucomicrobiales bacterium]|nr:aldehyde dehydrogenase family protein [Verrucomicrobiales bacterium]